MTQIVPVVPGFSKVVASGPQYGVKYVLTGPDGTRCVFNDPTDADYVGFLSNISGLDSPDVRESADDLIGEDGGVHGNFYYGRRPIVIEGQIDNRPGPQHTEVVTDQLLATNLLGNPGWETDTGCNSASSTLTRVTGTSLTTAGAGQCDHAAMTGVSSAIFYGLQSTGTGVNGTPVKPNTNYAGACGAHLSAPTGVTYLSVQCRIRWYDSAGATISDSVLQTQNTPGNGIWYQMSGVAASPSNAAYAAVLTYVTTSATGGTISFRTDNGLLSEGSSVPTWFDGDASPVMQVGQTYTVWTGTPHASQSSLYSVTSLIFGVNRVRNLRMTQLQRATNALRNNCQLRWMPDGGVEQVVNLRRQQPLRISGGFNKTFQAALVASDPRIYASAVQEARATTPSTDVTVTNQGSAATPPVLTLFGPSTGTMNTLTVKNQSTGESIVFAPAYTLGVGQSIVIDFVNKTVQRENGTNIYDQVQFASSTWWQLQPSDNLIRYTAAGTTTNSSLVIRWQDAWV